MSDSGPRPVVFISYSHKDEPKRSLDGQEQWCSYVKSHLDPLAHGGLIEIWDDRLIEGGAGWETEILKRLAECDLCLLLVSRNSLVSEFILSVEIRAMLERRQSEGAHIYPVLITPVALGGADWLSKMNIRPRDKEALSEMSQPDRDLTMVKLAEEIAEIAARVAAERSKRAEAGQTTVEVTTPSIPAARPDEIIHTIDRYEPKPEIFGREAEIETIVGALLAGKPAIVAGGPGMGKTAVATSALYDPRVVEAFGERRVFVSLEAASEPRALLARLVDALGLPATGDDVSLLRLLETHTGLRLLETHTRRPVAAILDNAETVFDVDRGEAERLLRLAAQIKGLSLVVTIRGVPPDVPGAVAIDDLLKLEPHAARDVFLATSGPGFGNDRDLAPLLGVLDGHALSIRLVAAQAKGLPSLAGLRESWEETRAKILRKPGEEETHLTSVRASLALSVEGRRVRDLPLARRLLTLLAYLPGGLAEGSVRGLLGERAAVTKAKANEAVGCLYQLRLVESGRPDRRLRMLTPLRECVRLDVPVAPADRKRLIDKYLSIAIKGNKIGRANWEQFRAEVEQEADNLDPVCDLAAEVSIGHRSLGQALLGLSEYYGFSGRGGVQSLSSAVKHLRSKQQPLLLANCIFGLGDIAFRRSDHDTARAGFDEALVLSRRVGEVRGEANCVSRLGDIALRRSEDDKALARIDEALALYRRVGDVNGEANCTTTLGNIALRRSDHETARASYDQALVLSRRVGSVHGEANCVNGLGDIAFQRSDHDTARARYDKALILYRRVGDVLGEANCILRLGNIALQRSDHDTAGARFHEAVVLYQRVGNVLGEASCVYHLGNIALRRSDHDTARARFNEALVLCRRVGDVFREAETTVRKGQAQAASGDSAQGIALIEAGFKLYYSASDAEDRALPGWRALHVALTSEPPDEAARQREVARQCWTAVGRSCHVNRRYQYSSDLFSARREVSRPKTLQNQGHV